MRQYKVTVTQTTPNGEVRDYDLDVIGASADSALAMVYGWYDRDTHYQAEIAGAGKVVAGPTNAKLEDKGLCALDDNCDGWKQHKEEQAKQLPTCISPNSPEAICWEDYDGDYDWEEDE